MRVVVTPAIGQRRHKPLNHHHADWLLESCFGAPRKLLFHINIYFPVVPRWNIGLYIHKHKHMFVYISKRFMREYVYEHAKHSILYTAYEALRVHWHFAFQFALLLYYGHLIFCIYHFCILT